MDNAKKRQASSALDITRCAIYTRKSTEEGLDQDFNTLDAQRESGEAYITSQRHEGWECVPIHYDDGGFTGGNMDRPALRRLMADIESGKVDCVVVYKVDRLSRSLLDFARIMETFDRHNVAFASVTQQFNTSTSMGRLVLNVLLSFAQFEREIISERTRDKIAAARRKGKWSGGMPLLGYNIDPHGSKLVVDDEEANRVQSIFNLYIERQSLLAVVAELDKREWTTKRWITKKGTERGGKRFTKSNLHKLLTNVTYIGKLRYKDEVNEGEHDAIISDEVWQQVQSQLSRNGRNGGANVRNKFGALLKGLIRCVPCNCAMSPSHSTKKGNRRYRYYVCTNAQKRGWHNCPSKSIPAGEFERFVVNQIKAIGRDSALIADTVAESRKTAESEMKSLEIELRGAQRELVHVNSEIRELLPLITPEDNETRETRRLADLHDRIRIGEQRVTEIQDQLRILERSTINEATVAAALSEFDLLWGSLPPRKQVALIGMLIERIDYDGETGDLQIVFHPTGIKSLSEQLETEEAA